MAKDVIFISLCHYVQELRFELHFKNNTVGGAAESKILAITQAIKNLGHITAAGVLYGKLVTDSR